jgi:hypothetical protein
VYNRFNLTLPHISELSVSLIGQIVLRQSFFIQLDFVGHVATWNSFCISLLVIHSAENAIDNDSYKEQAPCYDTSDDTFGVSRTVRPKLWPTNATGTVADEKHCIDDGSFRISLHIRGRERKKD